jgi:hypothetical protein
MARIKVEPSKIERGARKRPLGAHPALLQEEQQAQTDRDNEAHAQLH